MLPRLQPHYGSLPEVFPAEGKQRARVALFVGCASDVFYPQTTLATIHVLQRNGCEVWIPPHQGCCGALHYHAGLEELAKRRAATNCNVFSNSREVDAIVVNAAGCGAMLKDYGHLMDTTPLGGKAHAVATKIRDISEFLLELGPLRPEHSLPLRAAYHDACHLCHAQQIRSQPRQLLELIPGLELAPLAEQEVCCGAAGSYNLTEPDMAERLGRRKASNIREAGVRAVFAGNVGCLLQIGRYLRKARPKIWLAHPIDALWASYSGKVPVSLT
jgi:glycolate dehydrogenase iron-sulfur subunit